MKTMASLLIVSAILTSTNIYAQFKRLNKLNDRVFKEYEVKKYKESLKFDRTKNYETVEFIFCLDDSNIFIKTQYIDKDTIKEKVKRDFEYAFYNYNIGTHQFTEINNHSIIDSLSQLIANNAIQVEKGSFDKKEAKEIAKEVGKVVLDIVELALTNKSSDRIDNEFYINNFFNNGSILCKSIVISEYPSNDIKSTTLFVKNEERNYYTKFNFSGDYAFPVYIENFWLSPNGRFLLYKKSLLTD
jgi:hypothetical protein